MSKSPEGRVSKVDAGIISVGREDGDVLVQILEVERVDGSKQSPFLKHQLCRVTPMQNAND